MAPTNAWYFAYGSNMLDEVFVKRRQIQPLRHEIAVIQTHTLCFNVPGVPYADPAMGGIRPAEAQDVPVYGIAYLLRPEDMNRVVLTEGGGIAYETQSLIATLQVDGSAVSVLTLVARRAVSRRLERLPSKRYMGLLIRGAHEKGLPEEYQQRLVGQPTFDVASNTRFRLGKRLFDGIWQRVATWIQRGVKRFQGSDGNVPTWFLRGFDCLLWTMWAHHDYVHCVLWGRGDGL